MVSRIRILLAMSGPPENRKIKKVGQRGENSKHFDRVLMAPNDSASERLKQDDEIEKSKEVVLKYLALNLLY